MLNEEQREHFQELLLRERKDALEVLGRVDALGKSLEEQAGELSSYRFHPADLATESQEREKEFLLASKEGRRIYEIDEALQRLYKEPEQYGVCAECGNAISPERLEVVPSTLHCVTCAEGAEEESE